MAEPQASLRSGAHLWVSLMIQEFDTVQQESSDGAVMLPVLPPFQHQVARNPAPEVKGRESVSISIGRYQPSNKSFLAAQNDYLLV